MGPVDVNGSVHTARKQHQRICVRICACASCVDWAWVLLRDQDSVWVADAIFFFGGGLLQFSNLQLESPGENSKQSTNAAALFSHFNSLGKDQSVNWTWLAKSLSVSFSEPSQKTFWSFDCLCNDGGEGLLLHEFYDYTSCCSTIGTIKQQTQVIKCTISLVSVVPEHYCTPEYSCPYLIQISLSQLIPWNCAIHTRRDATRRDARSLLGGENPTVRTGLFTLHAKQQATQHQAPSTLDATRINGARSHLCAWCCVPCCLGCSVYRTVTTKGFAHPNLLRFSGGVQCERGLMRTNRTGPISSHHASLPVWMGPNY